MGRHFIERKPPAPPTPEDVVEALNEAHGLLANGLAKGSAVDWVDGWPCFCIVAAITATSRTQQIRDEALAAARRALPRGFHAGSIEAYNDHPGTTVSDAKALLLNAKCFVGVVAA
ncbi:DUF6197 family protein [Mycobacterium intracellulare]|uniref:Uncharacterized protein n=2 Tax=Mycobacterium intracellulare TaxID=1767 RepID=A0AAE4UEZ3_MYCIT|nr:hypothetical protein [Mycobacterium intracellulare]MDV6985117.1 hypothetical protein [Mycobacterium intracellulare]MDV7014263.1 hypothetical protein [Mycobacterium intracellulare]MDV7030108.1 hypothetical protein [Mycobacterium intracellulare]